MKRPSGGAQVCTFTQCVEQTILRRSAIGLQLQTTLVASITCSPILQGVGGFSAKMQGQHPKTWQLRQSPTCGALTQLQHLLRGLVRPHETARL